MPPFSHSSSEISHPSQSGESLSEAFLDASSRTRDALPEQYRTHFDELRGWILAFCHDFQIPVSALSNKEAFGAELTSKRIPPERMAQAVSLFARLEHLVTNRELLKEEHPEYLEEAERLYHLTEQYTVQVSLLERVGILKEGAITGIDGNKYPIPTLEQIAQHLYEQRETLSTKHDQGFTKLLLVPFGMSLNDLIATFRKFLLSYKLFHPDFNLNINNPFYTWEDGYKGADTGNPPKIFYYPTSFDPKNHQGQTKREILEAQADNLDSSSFPGWKVHLLQPSNIQDFEQDAPKGIALIPRVGQGKSHGKVTPRFSLEAGKSANDYLSTFEEAKDDPTSPYFQESSLTPEDWILAFMVHLQEIGKPFDNCQNGIESVTYLTGAFFPSIYGSAFVPCADWSRNFRRAELSIYGPHDCVENFGVRTSVIV